MVSFAASAPMPPWTDGQQAEKEKRTPQSMVKHTITMRKKDSIFTFQKRNNTNSYTAIYKNKHKPKFNDSEICKGYSSRNN